MRIKVRLVVKINNLTRIYFGREYKYLEMPVEFYEWAASRVNTYVCLYQDDFGKWFPLLSKD